MDYIQQTIQLTFRYPVHFTTAVFAPDNPLLAHLVGRAQNGPGRLLFVVDRGMHRHHPEILGAIERYASHHASALELACPPLLVQGGEDAKNTVRHVKMLHGVIADARLSRHSYVAVVGGGALIDMAGCAAATAHHGMRLIRIPTTALAQADAAVGLKNAINACGRKNFVGTFSPPFAVLNDADFLETLDDRDWRSGVAEAMKAGLMRDPSLFDFIEARAPRLAARDREVMRQVIRRSAELHLRHVATSGDPFELGTARSLDFGHWAAHRLEQLTDFGLRHGEAVAIGIALDTTYSYLAGLFPVGEWERVITTLRAIGFDLYVPELSLYLDAPDHPLGLLKGVAEYQEHFGNAPCIALLHRIGHAFDVSRLEEDMVRRSVAVLQHCASHFQRLAQIAA